MIVESDEHGLSTPLLRSWSRSSLRAIVRANDVQESRCLMLLLPGKPNARRMKRSINDQLTERAPNLDPGATPRCRNQRYMIVKCDEQSLPTGDATGH